MIALTLSARKATLADLLGRGHLKRSKTFHYIYDFGDNWLYAVKPEALVEWNCPDFDPDTVDENAIRKALAKLARSGRKKNRK